jgi:hypothetical protein
MKAYALAWGALLSCLSANFAAAQTMVCRHLPKNVFFSSQQPGGDQNELGPDRYCPVRLTLGNGEVKGQELCPTGTVPKRFVGTIIANPAYRGNVIVLWKADAMFAEAALWAISFERKEIGVAYAFAAHYTEVGTTWWRCSDR